VKLDVEQNEPVRNEQGLFLRCAQTKQGRRSPEFVATSRDWAAGRRLRCPGGHAKKDPPRRVAKGDAWFRTGDLMRKDEQGFFYFVIASATPSAEGENVATQRCRCDHGIFPE